MRGHENLIINLEPNKEPLAYLHKFTSNVSYSNEPIKIENFTGQKDLTKIEYNINQSSNKIQATEGCRIVREWFCGGPGNHTRDVEECGGHYIVSVKCTNGSSNQENTTGGPTTTGNTTGTSSNGGAETPTVVTAPVGPKPRTEILDQSKDPCETLKNTLDPTKANFKPAIVTLQGTLNQVGENGTTFGKDTAGNNIAPQPLPTTATNQISFTAVNNIYCIAHTHPADCYPMFSTPDVLSLLQLAQNALSSNIPEISLMLVVKDDAGVNQVYAITIGNLDVFTVAMTNLLDTVPDNGIDCTPLEKALKLDFPLADLYSKDSNFERAFLKNFAGFGREPNYNSEYF